VRAVKQESRLSRSLLDRERAYSVSERECLGVVYAKDRFKRDLCGKPFILETDNKPLEVPNKAESSNPRLTRWSLFLQTYKLKCENIPGM
jgi:hypothetical protein